MSIKEGTSPPIHGASQRPVIEDAIDPELPICDAHHHLWFPPNKQYLVEEFIKDIGNGHNIVKTVFVESMSVAREKKPLHETKFVHEITQEPVQGRFGNTQIAAGIVGYADFATGGAVTKIFEEHMAISDRFRGIRQAVAWDDGPRSDPYLKGIMGNTKFREGLSYLSKYNLVFDAMVYNTQLTELLGLAREFPDIIIILNHMATPRSIEATPEQISKWKHDIKELAACPNMFVKMGGLGMIYGHRDPDQTSQRTPGSADVAKTMERYFLYCIEQFGCNRCMFESNFPPDGFSFSYNTVWNVFKHVTKGFSNGERNALFHDTAVKIYRI